MAATTTIRRGPADHTGRIAAALVIVVAACWAYLLLLRAGMETTGSMGSAGGMDAMSGMAAMDSGGSQPLLAMPMTSSWTGHDIVLMWTMWAVMMAAMMLPSALPMVRTYSITVGTPARALRGSTSTFVAGYVMAWSGFAALATGTQWALHRATLVDAGGAATSRWLAGPVLVAAGAYQFTGLKHVCLSRCRSPLSFLLAEWRDGVGGALRMGSLHGVLCIGCCWALMALLFVLGVMNLWWVAILTTTVLLEKVTHMTAVPKLVGIGLLSSGVLVLLGVVGLSPR